MQKSSLRSVRSGSGHKLPLCARASALAGALALAACGDEPARSRATGGVSGAGVGGMGATVGGPSAGGSTPVGAGGFRSGEISSGGFTQVGSGGQGVGGMATGAGGSAGADLGVGGAGGIGAGGAEPGAGGMDVGAGGMDVGAGGMDVGAGGMDVGAGGAPPICSPNTGNKTDGDVNVDLDTEFQRITGFGGINVPGWIPDLTPQQTDTAFGNGPGQIGMTILRLRIPYDSNAFEAEVATAQRAVSHGAIVFASPWTPPAHMKTNNNIVGGELRTDYYDQYAAHLIGFRDYMESNGVPLHAISVQNEPDIRVDYESCDWNAQQFVSWLTSQGPKFGDTRVIAAESFNFTRTITDAILNSAQAEPQVDIIGGHVYGNGLRDYPLARQKGKEVWMTEHYTESQNDANRWPLALDVGKEINDCMKANFNAYVWWYIRRSYGPITEDGNVSKRGYLMAQYSKFVRPGYLRVGATDSNAGNVYATAYKGPDGKVAVVVVNTSTQSKTVTLDLYGTCVESLARYTTSGSKSLAEEGAVALTDHRAAVTLDSQSVTTFVSP